MAIECYDAHCGKHLKVEPYCSGDECMHEYRKKTVPDILREAADTYEQRHKLYGNNYKNFGAIMMALFPNGLTIQSPDDWNRLNMFIQCQGKLTRYAQMFTRGGHEDSAHDEIVYAAMMQELTDEHPF